MLCGNGLHYNERPLKKCCPDIYKHAGGGGQNNRNASKCDAVQHHELYTLTPPPMRLRLIWVNIERIKGILLHVGGKILKLISERSPVKSTKHLLSPHGSQNDSLKNIYIYIYIYIIYIYYICIYFLYIYIFLYIYFLYIYIYTVYISSHLYIFHKEGAMSSLAVVFRVPADISPTSQALCEDVVTVLTVFCERLESVDRWHGSLFLSMMWRDILFISWW